MSQSQPLGDAGLYIAVTLTLTRACLTLFLHVPKNCVWIFFCTCQFFLSVFYVKYICFIFGWICLRHRVLTLCARAVGMWLDLRSGRSKGLRNNETEKDLRGICENEEVPSFRSSHSCIRMNTFHFIFARFLVWIPSRDRLSRVSSSTSVVIWQLS